MIEPTLTARELFLSIYVPFAIFGSLYLSYSIPMLWEHYRKQDKRKRK